MKITVKQLRFSTSLPYVIGIAAAAFSLQAQAWDFTPDPSRVVSDPAYLPYQGQIYGSTGYGFTNTTADVLNSAGAQNRSYSTDSNSISQNLAYGVGSDLEIRMSESYNWSNTSNDYTSGTTTSTSSSGFVDPTFGVTWRVLDQKVAPLNFDLIASYAPDLIDAQGSSPDQAGTEARGGQVADFGAAASYKTHDFTIYGSGSADYLGDREILNADGSDTDYGFNWQYVLALSTQTRLTDTFSVNLGASETFNNSAGAVNDTTGNIHTSSPGDVTTLNAALNYNFIPNRLVGQLNYAHNFDSNSNSTYPNVPADNTETTSEGANVYGAKLMYVFN